MTPPKKPTNSIHSVALCQHLPVSYIVTNISFIPHKRSFYKNSLSRAQGVFDENEL